VGTVRATWTSTERLISAGNGTADREPPSPFRYFNSPPEVTRLVVMIYVRFPDAVRGIWRSVAIRGNRR
jgi:hypothetical protein